MNQKFMNNSNTLTPNKVFPTIYIENELTMSFIYSLSFFSFFSSYFFFYNSFPSYFFPSSLKNKNIQIERMESGIINSQPNTYIHNLNEKGKQPNFLFFLFFFLFS